jgi:stress response protein SCP2
MDIYTIDKNGDKKLLDISEGDLSNRVVIDLGKLPRNVEQLMVMKDAKPESQQSFNFGNEEFSKKREFNQEETKQFIEEIVQSTAEFLGSLSSIIKHD